MVGGMDNIIKTIEVLWEADTIGFDVILDRLKKSNVRVTAEQREQIQKRAETRKTLGEILAKDKK